MQVVSNTPIQREVLEKTNRHSARGVSLGISRIGLDSAPGGVVIHPADTFLIDWLPVIFLHQLMRKFNPEIRGTRLFFNQRSELWQIL
jgi:hypothetical protein